jgi:hypothetical protein
MAMSRKEKVLLIAVAKLVIHSTSGGEGPEGTFNRTFLDKAEAALADIETFEAEDDTQ